MNTNDVSDEAKKYAASMISKIDSGESGLFIESVNSEKQIEYMVFQENAFVGVFFSFIFDENLRIHIAFDDDTDKYNQDVYALLKSSLKKSKKNSASIWIWNKNRKIIGNIKKEFNSISDGEYDYASMEFIMHRNNFINNNNNHLLIKQYEEKYIDEYLLLLDKAMTFVTPPTNFKENKEGMHNKFMDRSENNSFEAFWKNDELIGLYWRKNAEIDVMAVSPKHQRKGYGSIILNRAIDMVFQNTDNEYAYLYAVDWNHKGQAFYKKYGMEINGHSYLLRI